jgi:hypothetical protein
VRRFLDAMEPLDGMDVAKVLPRIAVLLHATDRPPSRRPALRGSRRRRVLTVACQAVVADPISVRWTRHSSSGSLATMSKWRYSTGIANVGATGGTRAGELRPSGW